MTSRRSTLKFAAGMLASLLTMIYVKAGTSIAWTWYVVIGTAVTITVALVASLFESKEEHAGL